MPQSARDRHNLLKHDREIARRARKAEKATRMRRRKQLKEAGMTTDEIFALEASHDGRIQN